MLDAPTPCRCPTSPARSSCATSRSATTRTTAVLHDVDFERAGRPDRRAGRAPPAPASPRWSSCWRASTTREHGAVLDRRPRPAQGDDALAARAARRRAAGGLPVHRLDPRQHPLRAPVRRAPTRSSASRASSARTTSSSALPDGYDTEVHEGGGGLSTGQRQLISFARALLADPRVLILDEATSSVDAESERRIERAMDVLFSGRTSVIVAHRLSTVRYADQILVVDGGRDRRARHPRRADRPRRPLRRLYGEWEAHGRGAVSATLRPPKARVAPVRARRAHRATRARTR